MATLTVETVQAGLSQVARTADETGENFAFVKLDVSVSIYALPLRHSRLLLSVLPFSGRLAACPFLLFSFVRPALSPLLVLLLWPAYCAARGFAASNTVSSRTAAGYRCFVFSGTFRSCSFTPLLSISQGQGVGRLRRLVGILHAAAVHQGFRQPTLRRVGPGTASKPAGSRS